jgi:hypothetical protein
MSDATNTANDKIVEPTLTLTDWNEEWVALQEARKRPDESAYWDERSKTFRKNSTSDYSDKFIALLSPEPNDSIFDMGCGNGALSIPLAATGHDVVAADFSQGMLNSLAEDAAAKGVSGIKKICVSWADDWEAAGIAPKSADIALASRSIVTANLRDSLTRLSNVARKRCAITLPTGNSPRSDLAILEAIGIKSMLRADYLYAFMILVQMGYYPRVRYIPSTRFDSWNTAEDAYNSLAKMVHEVTSDNITGIDVEGALQNLHTWVDQNLIPNPEAGQTTKGGEVQGKFILREHRKITWAFIDWDVA